MYAFVMSTVHVVAMCLAVFLCFKMIYCIILQIIFYHQNVLMLDFELQLFYIYRNDFELIDRYTRREFQFI